MTQKISAGLFLASLLYALPCAAAPVVVDATNAAANGFSLVTTDNTGKIAATSGSASFEKGPATPPLGEGSVHFVTGAGHGDESAQLRYSGLGGSLLSSIKALSYSTYATDFNGSQLPYMNIFLDNVAGGGSDRLFYEPYLNGTVLADTWQSWDVLSGYIYSDDLGLNPELFSTYLADNPNATISVNPNLPTFRLQSGRASASDNFDTNVDALNINGTVFDFEVAAPELDPNSVATPLALTLGALLLASDRRRRA